MKRLYYIFTVLCAVAIASCSKDVEGLDSNITTTPKTLSITTKAFEETTSTTTRGVDAVEESTAINYWVLQFDESGSKLSDSKYFSDTDLSSLTINSSATTIWVVANTFSSTLFSSCTTLSDFKAMYFTLNTNTNQENGMWETISNINYLRMSGKWEGTVTSDTDYIGIILKPLAAKVTLTYSCPDNSDNSRVEISSIQLNNVAQHCQYSAVSGEAATIDMEYINYETYIVSDSENNSGTVSFYMPQNLKGESESTIAADKTSYAPANATYITITGTYYSISDIEGLEEQSTPVVIQIYPGTNSINNYDIALYKNYNVNCTISCDYNSWSSDSRVITSVELPEGAIIHYEFDSNDLSLNSAYDESESDELSWNKKDLYNPGYKTAYTSLSATGTDVSGDYLRNLAGNSSYNCTTITDMSIRYNNTEAIPFLKYEDGNNYLNSGYIQLHTGWGDGLNPSGNTFTIVFIGAVNNYRSSTYVGSGNSAGTIYYGTSNTNSNRWYVYNLNGQISYGMQTSSVQQIENVVVDDMEYILSFDICGGSNLTRSIYFNNIEVKSLTFSSYTWDTNMRIFGHKTSSSTYDATDGQLRLFLVYEKALTIEEIETIKNYATIKGLI